MVKYDLGNTYEQDPQKYMQGGIGDALALPRAALGYAGNKFLKMFGNDTLNANPYINTIETGIGSPKGSTRLGISTPSGIAPFVSFGGSGYEQVPTVGIKPTTTTPKAALAPITKTPQRATKASNKGKVINTNTTTSVDVPMPVPTVSMSPQGLPDNNYAEVPLEGGGFKRIYTPEQNVGYGREGNVFTAPFKEQVSVIGPNAGSMPPLGMSSNMVTRDMSPGSQGEWERNQLSNNRLQSFIDNVPKDIQGSALAYGAGMRRMVHDDALGLKQDELALKQQEAPFDRAYKKAITDNVGSEIYQRHAVLPYLLDKYGVENNQTVEQTKGIGATTQRTLGMESRDKALQPYNIKHIEAQINKLNMEGKFDEAKILTARVKAWVDVQGGNKAGDTGLAKQNEVAKGWFTKRDEADAMGNKAAADHYEFLANAAMKRPSHEFSNKGAAIGSPYTGEE